VTVRDVRPAVLRAAASSSSRGSSAPGNLDDERLDARLGDNGG
jgi:hypothetical protein